MPEPSEAAKPVSESTRRYRRYKNVVDYVTDQSSFELNDVQSRLPDERPAFVTKVIGELAKEGWIVSESSDETSAAYRWNTDRGDFPATRWLDDKIFGVQVKETPEEQRPREKLLSNGAEALSDAELLAILIRSGRPGESAVMGGEKVAKAFYEHLAQLPSAGRAELKEISPAVEKTAYCQIMAGIELGRRVAAEIEESEPTQITSANDAIAFCRKHFARLAADAKQEEFHIVTLDTKNQVMNTHRITVGTLDASLVHPREVFRPAIRDAASSIILVHNHPSGNPSPSREDHGVTQRLESSGELLGIDVLDHIIVARTGAVSIRQTR